MSTTDLDQALAAYREVRTAPAVDTESARTAVEALHGRRAAPRRAPVLAYVAAAVIALGSLWVMRPDQGPELALMPPPAPPVVHAPADADLDVDLGDDRLRLAAGGSLRLPPTPRDAVEVELLTGSVEATVEHRTEGETFAVVAGSVRVRVVGTRFVVDRSDGVRVRVSEGVVEVLDGGGIWTVRAGSELHWKNGEATLTSPPPPIAPPPVEAEPAVPPLTAAEAPAPLPPVAPPPPLEPTPELVTVTAPFDLAAVQAQLLGGDVPGAVLALQDRLAVVPADTDARRTLAGAHRRGGDVPAALQAWLDGIPHATGATRDRFRYEAAVLQQGDAPAAALALLNAFLESPARPSSLEGDALVRRGRALADLDRIEDARADWREVVRRFPGTAPATAAARLLSHQGG